MLRIRPKAGGGYTIPAGNLFAPGTRPTTRPEIYAMGLRNPFRIEIDPTTDASVRRRLLARRQRGRSRPRARPATASGRSITEPGNYGWPYCATAELPYVDYDFATGTSPAPKFNCDAPVNDSHQQHRPRRLPAVVAAARLVLLRRLPEFPELGEGGIGPMAGPAYQFDRRTAMGRKPVALAALLRRHAAVLRVDA